jgi:hypothetical protein
MGGDHRSRLTGERDWILERIEEEPDRSPSSRIASRSFMPAS